MLNLSMDFQAQLARDVLLALNGDLTNSKPLLADWLDYYRKTAQPAIFRVHEGGKVMVSGHATWRGLTPRYLRSARKRTSLHPRDILQLTGDFKKDLTTGTGYTFERFKISKDSAEVAFGTTRDYPRYVGAGNGGYRQAMYITPHTAKALSDITNHFISKIIVKSRSAGAKLSPRQGRVP